MTAGTATEAPTSKVPISNAEGVQLKPQAPAALGHRPSRSGRNPSGNANLKKTEDLWQQHSQPVGNASAPSTSSIDAKRDSFARKAKRDRTAFEGKLSQTHQAPSLTLAWMACARSCKVCIVFNLEKATDTLKAPSGLHSEVDALAFTSLEQPLA